MPENDTMLQSGNIEEDHHAAAETLPSVDWKISSDKLPLRFPRPDQVQVGLVQFPTDEDKSANIQRALQQGWQAAADGAEIIAFQEMFMLPWIFADNTEKYHALADEPESPVWEPFQSLAYEKGVVLVCSFYERGMEGRYYNSALIIDTDGIIAGRYRKRHLPPDNERVHFSPGNGPFSAFPTRKGNIGIYICWDNFFPEGARALALDGADIVFAPSAATELPSAYKWRTAVQHNALVNGIPWARINRCEAPFYSHRLLASAEGKIIFEDTDAHQHTAIVTVDYRETDRVRQEWPFLADRRPGLYSALSDQS